MNPKNPPIIELIKVRRNFDRLNPVWWVFIFGFLAGILGIIFSWRVAISGGLFFVITLVLFLIVAFKTN
tara:strand:+ start:6747 stop:6953 length:207 start_codon:yes stop_codon:yes gene_type:complete